MTDTSPANALHDSDRTESDEISLGDLFESVWRQRVPLLLALLGGGTVGALILGLMLALMPSADITSLSFRLRFAGANEGMYPNGMPFQPADIVAASVVRPVYNRMGLEELVSFNALKSSLTVVESSEALELIRREYEAKLSNAKLTQTERAALEEEYAARREAARTSHFRIQYLAGKDSRLPQEVAEALLPAVLESWAEQAQKVRGAWLYDVAIPGQGMLSENDLAQEDYLIVVDMLRITLNRVDRALAKLEQIPGANLARAPGDGGLSIVEARARLDDLIRFKIEPLFALVYGEGIFRDRNATTRYLEHRLFQLGLETRALSDKSASIEQVLNQLGQISQSSASGAPRPAASDAQRPVVIPQFGDGFMDRLMEVGAKTADVDFRRELSQQIVELRGAMIDIERERNLYRALLDGFSASESSISAGRRNAGESAVNTRLQDATLAIENRFAEVTRDSRFLITQLQGLHAVISEQSLQPHNIYAVSGPAERERLHSLGLRGMVGTLAAALMLGALAGGLIALHREMVRRRARH